MKSQNSFIDLVGISVDCAALLPFKSYYFANLIFLTV